MFKEVRQELSTGIKPLRPDLADLADHIGEVATELATTTSAQVQVTLYGYGLEPDQAYGQLLVTADGKRHQTLGLCSNLPVKIAGVTLPAATVVMDRAEKVLLLGMTWMKRHGIQLDLRDSMLHFTHQGRQHQAELKTTRDESKPANVSNERPPQDPEEEYEYEYETAPRKRTRKRRRLSYQGPYRWRCSRQRGVFLLSSQTLHSVNTFFPIPVILPDGHQTFSAHTAHIKLENQHYTSTLQPIVYPLQKYDLILGKPWLAEVNPLIDWRTNTLLIHQNGVDSDWVVISEQGMFDVAVRSDFRYESRRDDRQGFRRDVRRDQSQGSASRTSTSSRE
ncbi:hypothetical protein BGZ94_004831 [Podila epigama]|nr:hypothetical protein BGZ94_004831 [Podila epigama]